MFYIVSLISFVGCVFLFSCYTPGRHCRCLGRQPNCGTFWVDWCMSNKLNFCLNKSSGTKDFLVFSKYGTKNNQWIIVKRCKNRGFVDGSRSALGIEDQRCGSEMLESHAIFGFQYHWYLVINLKLGLLECWCQSDSCMQWSESWIIARVCT